MNKLKRLTGNNVLLTRKKKITWQLLQVNCHQLQKAFTSVQSGFTLIELLVVIGIIGILLSMATISLVQTQHRASVSATVDQFIADMRLQQTKAMTGIKDTTGNANNYGIHVYSDRYVLFQGASDPLDSTDFTVAVEGVSFTTNLPSNSIVFAKRTGKFTNFVSGTYTITVSNVSGDEQKIITVNKYGVVTDVQ